MEKKSTGMVRQKKILIGREIIKFVIGIKNGKI